MRLIDLDELQKYPFRRSNYDEKGNLRFISGVESLMEYAETLPTIDPEELKPKGTWKRYHKADLGWDEYGVECSVCGLEVERGERFYRSNYCPRCGAKLEE